ncbi:hypothetical protein N7532_009079 [Penicillium argentinense]|uniref:USP domain-containing protein n=1 Tax=Penicillium argentinense TaxID=1131581 RepID=A0A9W9EYU1_9EURO|nr:uncharacterized protein N7532_009079 [Penicillium argentinense]KAJ5090395.1 hypothetical protein N7532_009079 [Penicillium argentinense]
MAGSYVGGSAAFSSLFYSQDAAANPGGSGFAGLTKLGGTSKPQEAVGLTPDKEHRRLENEARQAGARDRGFNRRATALSFRSPFPPLWDEWTAEQTQVGFENPGNSCYRNVVFQLLAHSPAIVRWARWYKDRHIPPSFLCELGTDGGECLICMLHNFLASYWDSSMNELDQKFDIFWKEVYEEWCVENECVMEGQQDPGELLMDIYRQLDAALPAVYSDDLPQITDIEATTIQQCQGQGACEDSEEVRSWPRLVVNYGESDLVDIVQNTVSELFTQQSTLPACEKCSGKKVEQAYLIRAPEHLAVQVNRTNDLGIKVQRPIEFSEKLTLAKEWLDPGIKKDGLYDVEYELSAVILHDGANTRTGHYTIIVKGRTGQWTLIDDEIVKSIHFSDFKGLQKNQEHAYLFSYTRVPFHETREKALRYQQIWNPKLSQGGYGSSPYSPAETARNHPTSSSSRGRRTDSDPMDVDEQGIPNPPRPPSPPPVRTYTPAPPPSPPPPNQKSQKNREDEETEEGEKGEEGEGSEAEEGDNEMGVSYYSYE